MDEFGGLEAELTKLMEEIDEVEVPSPDGPPEVTPDYPEVRPEVAIGGGAAALLWAAAVGSSIDALWERLRAWPLSSS